MKNDITNPNPNPNINEFRCYEAKIEVKGWQLHRWY